MSKEKIEQCKKLVKLEGTCRKSENFVCKLCPRKLYKYCLISKEILSSERLELAKKYIEKHTKKELDLSNLNFENPKPIMPTVSFYDMLINNAKNYLRNTSESDIDKGQNINAFQISEVLSICLCKSKEEIVVDLIKK